MRDFSHRQAAGWVRHEAAKHKTPAARAERIEAEQITLSIYEGAASLSSAFPNSMRAHRDLIAVLRQGLAS